MTDRWRKFDRGLFESPDGQWRIANPWKLTTELRHRWLVAERRASGSGWSMHDGDHATLVHLNQAQFSRLMADARHGRFSVHD